MLVALSENYLCRSLQLIITKGQLFAGFEHNFDKSVNCMPPTIQQLNQFPHLLHQMKSIACSKLNLTNTII